jgi:hypothetical protein
MIEACVDAVNSSDAEQTGKAREPNRIIRRYARYLAPLVRALVIDVATTRTTCSGSSRSGHAHSCSWPPPIRTRRHDDARPPMDLLSTKSSPGRTLRAPDPPNGPVPVCRDRSCRWILHRRVQNPLPRPASFRAGAPGRRVAAVLGARRRASRHLAPPCRAGRSCPPRGAGRRRCGGDTPPRRLALGGDRVCPPAAPGSGRARRFPVGTSAHPRGAHGMAGRGLSPLTPSGPERRLDIGQIGSDAFIQIPWRARLTPGTRRSRWRLPWLLIAFGWQGR